jgi:hypothetical protein
VADSIIRLSDVKKDTPAILSSLKGGGNGIRDADALPDSKVEGSETKLVGGDRKNKTRHLPFRVREIWVPSTYVYNASYPVFKTICRQIGTNVLVVHTVICQQKHK